MSTSARPLIPIPPIPTKCTCCGLKNTSILYCFGFRAVCQEEGVSGQGSVVRKQKAEDGRQESEGRHLQQDIPQQLREGCGNSRAHCQHFFAGQGLVA